MPKNSNSTERMFTPKVSRGLKYKVIGELMT